MSEMALAKIRSICKRTALHIRRDGVLAELSDLPLKSLVHAASGVQVGQRLHLRLTGVDLWRAHAHFLVDP